MPQNAKKETIFTYTDNSDEQENKVILDNLKEKAQAQFNCNILYVLRLAFINF